MGVLQRSRLSTLEHAGQAVAAREPWGGAGRVGALTPQPTGGIASDTNI